MANRVTVLRDGQRVGTFPAKEVSTEDVVRLMVGRDLLTVDKTHSKPQFRPPEGEPPLLDVRGLSRLGVLHDITFSLKQGEILGLAGLIGSGRSEIARALIGIDPIDAGEFRIDGKVPRLSSPSAALKAGLVLVPEDRHIQGLMMRHTVEQNIVLPLLRQNSQWGIVDTRACRRIALEAVEQLRIVPPDVTKTVRFLSGGNQQKVVLAKWLAGKPKILILDEPTVGIDVGSKAEIHQLIRNLADSGIGILLISSDMPEIIALSHRMLVMHDGRIHGEFSQEEVTEEKIMAKIMEQIMARREKKTS
ncbi:MAG: sugar ABC transporter ATP-binding protein [Burkholderiales bacterium]|nr:sugar ABC transporter ATP-binding protein [Anaerolineae bacterium]